jgi:hypothetical protein
MPNIFDLDQKDLKKLIRFAKKAPTHFRRASKDVLNDLAFSTMKINKDQIKRTMTVRNNSFVNSSFRVDKARTSSSISLQEAIVGSIRRDQFSGWDEQELGKPTDRERKASIRARGGSKAGRVKPKFRMKSGRRFKRPQQFKGRNFPFKFRTMLRVFDTRKRRELFYMDRKYKGMIRYTQEKRALLHGS